MSRYQRAVSWVMLASMTVQTFAAPAARADHFFAKVGRLIYEKEYDGKEPETCSDGAIEYLAENIDWLEHHVDQYGSIVAKQPDVWGEARLTKHRDEYEKILFQELNQFQFKLNGVIRQSDQSFASAALALSDAASTTTSSSSRTTTPGHRRLFGGPTVVVEDKSQTVTPVTVAPTDLAKILPTSPAQEFTAPATLSRFEGDDKINIEPTVYLDQMSRYVQHLHELRRINEGDDTSDAPGYALDLVRIPVSVLPGKLTEEGFGAEITVTGTPVLTDDLLPTTFRNLVVNDLVSQMSLTLVKFAEAKAWEKLPQAREIEETKLLLERLGRQRESVQNSLAEVELKLEKFREQQKSLNEGERRVAAELASKVTTLAASSSPEAIALAGRYLTVAAEQLRPEVVRPALVTPSPPDLAYSKLKASGEGLMNAATRRLSSEAGAQLSKQDKTWARNPTEQRLMSFSEVANDTYTALEIDSSRRRLLEKELGPFKKDVDSAVGKVNQIKRQQSVVSQQASKSQNEFDSLTATKALLDGELNQVNTEIGEANRILSLAGSVGGAPTDRGHRATNPLPPTQVVDVFGIDCLAEISHEFYKSYQGRDVRWAGSPDCDKGECRVDLLDMRRWLHEELEAAFELLSQRDHVPVWYDTAHPQFGLARAIRENQIPCDVRTADCKYPCETLPRRRADFFQGLHANDPKGTRGGACCTETIECLAWAIVVESALLNDRLNEDIRRTAVAKEVYELQNRAEVAYFLPEAVMKAENGLDQFQGEYREAAETFKEYVKARWPIHVFSIDPNEQDQNIADYSSRRRELQLALSMGFTQGIISANTLMQYSRQLETEVETISLNQTAVGFGHGDDTFGWRFYPRVQALDQPGAIGSVWQSFRGTPRDHDLRKRRLEPGMRECVAVVLMPTFVPYVDFDVRTNWFRVTNPKNAALTMKDTMKLSRAITAMRNSQAQCARCAQCYRDGEVGRLMKRVEQLDHELPLQTMRQQIPFENTLGGFEMFSTGVTDFAPELYGWYGAPGVVVGDGPYQCGCYADCQFCTAEDKTCLRTPVNAATLLQTGDLKIKTQPLPVCSGAGTTVFLVGDHLSVHDTKVIAGGVCISDVQLVSREIMRVTIPSCVNKVEVAGQEYVAVYAATPYGVTNHLHIPVTKNPLTKEATDLAKAVKGLQSDIAALSAAAPSFAVDEDFVLAFDANCATPGGADLTIVSKMPASVDLKTSTPYPVDPNAPQTATVRMGIRYDGRIQGDLVPLASSMTLQNGVNTIDLTQISDAITARLENAIPTITMTSFKDGKAEASAVLFYTTTNGNQSCCELPMLGEIPIVITLACPCCAAANGTPTLTPAPSDCCPEAPTPAVPNPLSIPAATPSQPAEPLPPLPGAANGAPSPATGSSIAPFSDEELANAADGVWQ